MVWRRLLWVTLLGVLACATPGGVGSTSAPYTPEQIRNATKTGRTYEFLDEIPGKPTTRRILTFTRVSFGGADIRSEMEDENGNLLQLPTITSVSWDEVLKQAGFPTTSLQVEETSVVVPAGSFECRRYTITEGAGEDAITSHADFPYNVPGPPIRYVSEQKGKIVRTLTLIRYDPGH
jgi:hypothetical protein